MRIGVRKRELRSAIFCYALVTTTILIALFGALVLGHANKPIDCSWPNQSRRSTSQVPSVDWHCANSDYIATRR